MFVHMKLVCLLQKNGTKRVCCTYILKIICLLQKYGKNGYDVHIKTSMFTTEIQKKRYVALNTPVLGIGETPSACLRKPY